MQHSRDFGPEVVAPLQYLDASAVVSQIPRSHKPWLARCLIPRAVPTTRRSTNTVTRQTFSSLERTAEILSVLQQQGRSEVQAVSDPLLEHTPWGDAPTNGRTAAVGVHGQNGAANPVPAGSVVVNLALRTILREQLAQRYGCVPIQIDRDKLVVAASRPLPLDSLRALEFATGRRVVARLAPEADVQDAFFHLYTAPALVKQRVDGVALTTQQSLATQTPTRAFMAALSHTGNRVWMNVLWLLAYDAVQSDARAMHLHLGPNFLKVYHVTGTTLERVFSLPGWMGAHLVEWWTREHGAQADLPLLLPFAGRTRAVRAHMLEAAHGPLVQVPLAPDATNPYPKKALAYQAPSSAEHRQTPSCPRCYTSISATTVLCPRCHAPVRRLCRTCGMRLLQHYQICPCCGAAATPATAANTAAPLAPTGPPLRERPVGAPPTLLHVLVVDDQPDVRLCTASALRCPSLRISMAGSGAEALTYVGEDPPHVIVLDMIMPEMSGTQVLQLLRASIRTAFIPVVAVTVLDPDDPRIQTALGPGDSCLQKPVSRQTLLRCVQQVVRRHYGIALDSTTDGAASTPRQNLFMESERNRR